MSKRLRVYPWLIASTLWCVLAVDFATSGAIDRAGKLKGTDFVQFYVGASFVREGRLDLLYEPAAQ